MDWDLGIVGLLALGSLSIGVGLVAQVLSGASGPNWLWLSVSALYFVVAVLIGDAWFGWVTRDELSLEDLLLVVLAPIPAVLIVTRSLVNRGASDGSSAPRPAGRWRHPRPQAL